MHVPLRLVEDVHVHLLPHILVVQGTVAVGHHVAGPGGCRRASVLKVFQIALVGLLPPLRDVPVLQKHHGKTLHRVPLEHHRRVLPVAEALLPVDVLIRQIDAAGEGRVAVDHHDLPVIPVVLVGGQHRAHRGEHLAADAHGLQFRRVAVGQKGQTAHAVVHDADLHPLSGLLLQNLQDGLPHDALADDEILQKDKMPGSPQLALQLLKFVLPQGKIRDRRVLVGGISAPAVHVPQKGAPRRVVLRKIPLRPGILGQIGAGLPRHLADPRRHQPGGNLQLHKQVEKGAEHRQGQHRDHPGDLVLRALLLI